MKDEELAEEYIKDNCIRWECDSLPVDDIAKENFLAGLKAGRPQWHDLQEDPNDLPEAHWKNWVIAVYDGGILWCRARREECVDGVYWVNSYHHTIENVVMWAKIEIPTFDKE